MAFDQLKFRQWMADEVARAAQVLANAKDGEIAAARVAFDQVADRLKDGISNRQAAYDDLQAFDTVNPGALSGTTRG